MTWSPGGVKYNIPSYLVAGKKKKNYTSSSFFPPLQSWKFSLSYNERHIKNISTIFLITNLGKFHISMKKLKVSSTLTYVILGALKVVLTLTNILDNYRRTQNSESMDHGTYRHLYEVAMPPGIYSLP